MKVDNIKMKVDNIKMKVDNIRLAQPEKIRYNGVLDMET
jgi:hypothetical protein